MAEIIHIDDHRTHLSVPDVNGDEHVIPVMFFENVARGKVPLSQLEEYELLLPTIIGEWLECRVNHNG